MFKIKRVRFVNVEDFNRRMTECKKYRKLYLREANEHDMVSLMNAFFDCNLATASLTYYSEEGVTTYKVRLDSDSDVIPQMINGGDSYRTLSRYYKIPKYSNIKFSAKAITWMNPKYDSTRQHVYYYDLNSAYATVMANYDFPDTSVEPKQKVVSEGEIGFTESGDIAHPGQYALWVFPTMESPFKKFVARWYERKKNAKTPAEKTKAKNMLCYCVGYMQKINPFLRAFIINSCNEYIQSLMNEETTIYCNTDCIVSLVPLPELKIGEELGEWKFKEGEFAYKGFNYQFNKETPMWKGIPKGWWEKHPDFDILTDEPPHGGNVYEFDFIDFQIKKVKYEI